MSKPPIPQRLPFARPSCHVQSGDSAFISMVGGSISVPGIPRVEGNLIYARTDFDVLEARINPWSVMREFQGHARVEVNNCFFHVFDFVAVAACSPICVEISRSIRRICEELLDMAGISRIAPAFSTLENQRGAFKALLGGPCIHLHLLSGLPSPDGDSSTQAGYLELQLPSSRHLVGVEPVRLALYEDVTRVEMILSIPLGVLTNRVVLNRVSTRMDNCNWPEEVLIVEGHLLRFRCREEAEFWKVGIEDAIASSPKRWDELVDERTQNAVAPKGYRGQYNRLQTILRDMFKADVTSDFDLLARSLESLDSLIERLSKCRCRKTIDISEEDSIFETRAKLAERIRPPSLKSPS
jgi:hypothetical protein